MDPMAARDFLEDPSKLLQVDLPFIKDLQKQAPGLCPSFSSSCRFREFSSGPHIMIIIEYDSLYASIGA